LLSTRQDSSNREQSANNQRTNSEQSASENLPLGSATSHSRDAADVKSIENGGILGVRIGTGVGASGVASHHHGESEVDTHLVEGATHQIYTTLDVQPQATSPTENEDASGEVQEEASGDQFQNERVSNHDLSASANTDSVVRTTTVHAGAAVILSTCFPIGRM
jgi:hypothetical protein